MYRALILFYTFVLVGCQHHALNEVYLSNSEDPRAAKAPYIPPGLYCYKSLGDPDCYRRPVHGREAQLINFYDQEKKCTKEGKGFSSFPPRCKNVLITD